MNAIDEIWNALQQRPNAYLLGIAGIPGSGKSTLSAQLCGRIPGSIVLPMDGYHIPKCQLDADGLRRRGAPHTFDRAAFREDLIELREAHRGSFPAFDHAEKDPRAYAIQVTPAEQLVIVEGLYLLMRDWQLDGIFDLTVFLDCDLQTATDRLAARHLACGLVATMDEARARAETNDRFNALTILNDGCRERADLVIVTG